MRYLFVSLCLLLAGSLFAQEDGKTKITFHGSKYIYNGNLMGRNHLMYLLDKEPIPATIRTEAHQSRIMGWTYQTSGYTSIGMIAFGAGLAAELYFFSHISITPNSTPAHVDYAGPIALMLTGIGCGIFSLSIHIKSDEHALKAIQLYNQSVE